MHASGLGELERGVPTYNVEGCIVEGNMRLGRSGVGQEFELGVGP